ncbi:hypothetical protein K501DRAFT_307683 [Backusella circina FSU 941]|nr:hypothetical protein K501DRAFT_307683 [Backusella circina FSU 941]
MKRAYEKLSTPDKISVDFCRCLYQAKAIVKELKSFGDSVCPALNVYPDFIKSNNLLLDGPLVLKQVNKYLDTTFQKFNRLCQILLMVLSKMESKSSSLIKKERIDSFRSEVWDEWNTATFIKQRLLHSIHSNTTMSPPSSTAEKQHHLLIKHSTNATITTTTTTTTTTTITTTTTSTTLASTSVPKTTITASTTTKSCISPQCTSA